MLAWKTITLLWPFLKELFLGKKTLREALKTNKGRVFMIAMIIGSAVMNVWLVPNIVRISTEYVDLKHKYDSSDSQPSDQQTTPSVAVRDENGKLLCPIEKFTNVGNMPALPTDQLRQLGPNDKDAIIRLLTNHIDELRQHGRKVQDQQNAEHRRYINDCRRWLLQHQQ